MTHDLVESDGPAMDAYARWLVSKAHQYGLIVILIHHSSQGATLESRDDHHAGRGATDFPAACRAVWILRGMTSSEAEGFVDHAGNPIDNKRCRVLTNAKSSHAAPGVVRHLVFGQNGVLRAEELDTKENEARSNSGAAAPYGKGKGLHAGMRGGAYG